MTKSQFTQGGVIELWLVCFLYPCRDYISETIRARLLGFGMQISELLAQRKFVLGGCHAHFNAHNPPKTVATAVLMLE